MQPQILNQHGVPFSQSSELAIEASQQLAKAWRKIPDGKPDRAPKSYTYDPMSLMYSLGYKDRQFGLTYGVIRQVMKQLSLSAAIVKHRINQVIQFCTPYSISRESSGLGFQIKHKEPNRVMSKSEKRFAGELEKFILYCGDPKPNKYTKKRRPDFEEFTKKFLRDLLELDQGCAELVPRKRSKIPYEFLAVDGATIRIAAEQHNQLGKRDQDIQQQVIRTLYDSIGKHSLHPQYSARNINVTSDISHIQLVRGQIETLYADGQMAFCTQNPRTDLIINGYGESNVEILIKIITAHLYAEQHNLNVFKQGSLPKSMFNVVSENVAPEQLENFRRQWQAQVTSTDNSWKTPFLAGPEIQHIQLQGTNQEMEFQNWLQYLIRIQCAVWQIDSAEIGFDLSPPAGQFAPPNVESPQEWKIKKSKDRGLRPLLRYYAYCLNKHIIDKIDDHFYLDFVGLDELDQKTQVELLQQEVSVYRTPNEAREMRGLPPIEDGDVPLNPILLQYKQMKMNDQQQGGEPGQEGEQQQEEDPEAVQKEHDEMMGHIDPQYEEDRKSLDGSTFKKAFDHINDSDLQARVDHALGYVEVQV